MNKNKYEKQPFSTWKLEIVCSPKMIKFHWSSQRYCYNSLILVKVVLNKTSSARSNNNDAASILHTFIMPFCLPKGISFSTWIFIIITTTNYEVVLCSFLYKKTPGIFSHLCMYLQISWEVYPRRNMLLPRLIGWSIHTYNHPITLALIF